MKQFDRRRYPGRLLGHEWAEWDGAVEPNGGVTESRKRLYLGFLLLGVSAMAALGGAASWAAHLAIGEMAGWALAALVVVAGSAALAAYSLLVLSILAHRNLFGGVWIVSLLARSVYFASFFARGFGVTRDRVGSGFVKVANLLSRPFFERDPRRKALVLVPRCLASINKNEVSEATKGYEVQVSLATNGEMARKHVKDFRPSVIVAIACERDLVSGLRDVGGRVPVFSIPLRRPEGPCKNCHVEIPMLGDALHSTARTGTAQSVTEDPADFAP